MKRQLDFIITCEGSTWLLLPRNDAARAWAAEHLPEDSLMFGRAIVIEHCYVDDIVAGIENDGLIVRVPA
jgi:hypothetical protein